MIAQIKIRRGTTAEWAAASPVVLAEGEPGWDTTLKGMKVGDGETEWAELPWIDSKNNPTVNRQNILHNPDFRNPINQRGVSGEISTGTYFFDRWIRNSGTVTVNAGYLTMANGAVIEQRIEGLNLAGATVTASVNVGSNVYSGKSVFPASVGTVDVTLTGFGTATLGYNADYMFVRFTASGSQNVVAVKCELGTASTLHLDPPMDHAVELPKCQRFFLSLAQAGKTNFSRFGMGIATDATTLYVFVPNTLRIVPSIIYSGNFRIVPNLTAVSSIEVASNSPVPNGLALHVTTTGMTAGASYFLTAASDPNAYIYLSSDL